MMFIGDVIRSIIIIIVNIIFIYGRSVTVSGYIQDNRNEEIPEALVIFINKHDMDTISTLSDVNGHYTVELAIGEESIEDQKDRYPSEFKLYQNYPNPFNPGTVIEFELPEPGHITITVFNLLGQIVEVITDRYYPKGISRIYWDGCDSKDNGAASGVYYYRIEAGNFMDTKKMLLLDGGSRGVMGNTAKLSHKPLLKTNKILVQETFIIHAEKAGFFFFFDDDFVVTSEDTAIEKNIVLSQYAICYNNIIDWGDPYSLDWEIFISDINGDSIKNISNHPEEDDYNPAWSPDGRYIAYRRDKSVGGCDIYLYDIIGDSLINLTNDLADNESASSPSWTPDGEKIIYRYHKMGENRCQYIMNKDGSNKRKLSDWVRFFYSDSYHFICNREDSIYKTDIDGVSNELLMDLDTLGEYTVWIDDFNPDEETFLCHEDSADWTFCYSFLIKTYNFKTAEIDTLTVADSGWIYIHPEYSNDYSKISMIEKYIYDDKHIEKIVILENGIKKELVRLTDKDEWIDSHSMVFSPKDNYLTYSKNINQGTNPVWWKSYLHIVNINTNEIRFIDEDKAVCPQWNPLLSY